MNARDYILSRRTKEKRPPVIITLGDFDYFAFSKSAGSVRKFRTQFRDEKGEHIPEIVEQMTERKVVWGISDAQGVPIFSDEDVSALASAGFNKELEILAAAVDEANFISGGEYEAYKKKSPTAPMNGSSSNSASGSVAPTSTPSSQK